MKSSLLTAGMRKHGWGGGKLLASLSLVCVGVVAVGSAEAADSGGSCSAATGKAVGLLPNPGRPPASPELHDMNPSYVAHRLKQRNYCLIDVWMVPTTGTWTGRYAALVQVDRRSIVGYRQLTVWSAASPHRWPISAYKTATLGPAEKQELLGLFCFSGVPTVNTKDLYRRLTGQPLPASSSSTSTASGGWSIKRAGPPVAEVG